MIYSCGRIDFLPLGVPQHPYEHRPHRPALLVVDQ